MEINYGLDGIGYVLITDPTMSLSTLYLVAGYMYHRTYSLRSAADEEWENDMHPSEYSVTSKVFKLRDLRAEPFLCSCDPHTVQNGHGTSCSLGSLQGSLQKDSASSMTKIP